MIKTILITGASGNIGSKLSAFLAPDYKLRLLDVEDGPNIIVSDLTEYDDEWARHFDGVDTVIHLAGEMRPTASWSECHSGNVVGTSNVLRACRKYAVRRVVYASSNQVMAGYRLLEGNVTTEMSPKPLNPYGISKLICEEMCRSLAAETDISVIALRIGYIDPGENIPGPDMAIGLWGQQMWVSNRDVLSAVKCAIIVENGSFSIFNLVSNNKGSRWEIDSARSAIGFVPQDQHDPVMLQANIEDDEKAKKAVLVPGYWLDQYFDHLDVD